jgi:hypothetical protein
MSASSILIELHYLPCIDYFVSIIKSGRLHIEIHENYQKQSYRNRTSILGANKIQTLTIPVCHGQGIPILMKDTKIDYGQNWMNIHLRSIRSGYAKSPFFDYYFESFEQVLLKRHRFLWDLNLELLTVCLKLLNLKTAILFTQTYNFEPDVEIMDLRNEINPKKESYNQDIIDRLSYTQTFGKAFAGNLSIIDLLFCEGNNSLKHLAEICHLDKYKKSNK